MSDSAALGTYRGVVVNSNDPQAGGRVTLKVPQVLGDAESNWAVPSTPAYFIPTPGDLLWVSFEGGDVTHPVYTPPGLRQLGETIEGLEGVEFSGSPPKAPTALALTTSSATSAEGVTSAMVGATWAATTENQDGTVITRLAGYRVQYSYDGVQWTGGAFTAETSWLFTGIRPGVLVQVRVQSLNNSSGPSAWSIKSITTSGTAGPIQGEHIADDAIDGKVITGALIRTARPEDGGPRWEITSTPANTIDGYSGVVGETAPGGLLVEGGEYPWLQLRAPDSGHGAAYLNLLSPAPGAQNPRTQVELYADNGDIGPLHWDAWGTRLDGMITTSDSIVSSVDAGWQVVAQSGYRFGPFAFVHLEVKRTGADLASSADGNITNQRIGLMNAEWCPVSQPAALSTSHAGQMISAFVYPNNGLAPDRQIAVSAMLPNVAWVTDRIIALTGCYPLTY